MKNFTQAQIIISILVAMIVFQSAFYFFLQEEAYAKIREAEKPSAIEKQFEFVKSKEQEWREAESYCQKKPQLEQQIHEGRKKLLGLKK